MKRNHSLGSKATYNSDKANHIPCYHYISDLSDMDSKIFITLKLEINKSQIHQNNSIKIEKRNVHPFLCTSCLWFCPKDRLLWSEIEKKNTYLEDKKKYYRFFCSFFVFYQCQYPNTRDLHSIFELSPAHRGGFSNHRTIIPSLLNYLSIITFFFFSIVRFLVPLLLLTLWVCPALFLNSQRALKIKNERKKWKEKLATNNHLFILKSAPDLNYRHFFSFHFFSLALFISYLFFSCSFFYIYFFTHS